MPKYSVVVITALSLLPSNLLAHANDAVPNFSGAYQMSGQDTCSDFIATNWATGVFTFASGGNSFDLFEYDNQGTLQGQHNPDVPYTETSTTMSFNGYTYAMTTKVDRKGVVHSATLNGTYSDQRHTCRSQMMLFR